MYLSIKEEFEKLKHSKIILIACLIIPIVTNLLIGAELSKGVIDHIPMAVCDYDETGLSRTIIKYFGQNEAFDIQYHENNINNLQKLLDNSKVKVAVVIPKGFEQDVKALRSPSVLMLYDGSHMSVLSVAKAKATEILLTLKVGAEVQQITGRFSISQGRALAEAMPINSTNRTLYNPYKNFQYFLLPGYGTAICQTGIALTAALGNKFSKERKRHLTYVAGKIFFYGSIGSISFIINVLAQIYLFKMPFAGSLFSAMLLCVLIAFSVAAMCTAVSSWVTNDLVAVVICALLTIPNSVMTGYTWPVTAMLSYYRKQAKVIPFYYFGDNLRDLFIKGKMIDFYGSVKFFLLFTVIMILAACIGNIIIPRIMPEAEGKR